LMAIYELEFNVDLFTHAMEKDIENQSWQTWLSLYPYMMTSQIEFISFETYKEKQITRTEKVSRKTAQEIEAEFKGLIGR